MSPKPAPRVTSRDVARAAGVSQPTVSRALRDDPSVAPATAARIRQVADDLGYVPNPVGRSLVTRTTSTIAVVVADIDNPFYAALVQHLHRDLGTTGYRSVLFTESTDGGIDDGLLTMLMSGFVDGAVIATALLGEATEQMLASVELPIVLINRDQDAVHQDSFVADNRTGAREVAELMIGLGHRRLAHVAGPPLTSTGRDRLRGFREAAEAAAGDDVVVTYAYAESFSHDQGRQACDELLGADRPPTAIFCANDVVATGALDAALGRGLRVPEDLTVVGFDDIAMARWHTFGLTTVRQPIEAMARDAVAAVLARIAGTRSGPAERRSYPVELVLRATHGPAPGT